MAVSSNARAKDQPPTDSAKKREITKGIMWACVPGSASVMDKFKMVQDAGFEGIEIESAMDRAEVLKARDATGLHLPSVVCSTHWREPVTDPNPKVREAGLEGLKTALRDAKEYGSSSVLFVPAVVKREVSYDTAYTRSQAAIRSAIPLAEELGVKIAVENVWNNFLLSPMEAARYIDEFQSPAVVWHFDIGNCINNGWPEHWIHILGPRVHKLHIKEYSRKLRDEQGLWKGFQVEYRQGDNDWPAVMQALDDIGYKGWGTAEPAYWPHGLDLAERLRQVSHKLDEIYAL
jgi:L-ribulose-5-phosphate 3-epimerase